MNSRTEGIESRLAEAQARMLALLKDAGLPDPETVEHDEDCVRLIWADRKVVVVVEVA